ncbi:hypothetical protein VA249_31690 [Vibrio alfacsensis]|uniref:aspartate-semialdehyde dehydrogenase n=1 Tax=Vibrio alfacsensis TaxID=1074311 RepID=UPI001BF04C3C|nr:aspartate-semialdehyde dehydrogenase [Vibrio alfacsensis]WQE78093.1 aspartate-semialdehyde dehydrogenase [Vibrio alfacsensis]BBM66523.1 hypothetical protein VA249_31690 [Vibrio alfacsensis]
MKETVIKITDTLLLSAKDKNFSGYDPFDGLNSKLFNIYPSLRNSIFGLAWIQLHKRLGVNLRPIFGIEAKRNPKGIGLFILGLLENYKSTGDQKYLKEATYLADWLLTQQSDRSQWEYSCWGYHFDWKARAFFVPRGKPNIITTIYVAQALYALSEITNDMKYLDPAIDSAHFIVEHLYTERDNRSFFAYIPGEEAFVHNASLWGAAWVAKVASLTNNDIYKELALNVARQSVQEQNNDGSWVYGSRHHHQFIDGFHTGYNLEALRMISDALATTEFESSIDKGLTYYKQYLFEPDGTAKYYHNNAFPLDMHSVSQAILTLLKVGGTPEDIMMAKTVLQRSLETLYLPQKKRFCYQKNRFFTNNVDYIRWTQAWVYYSFSFLNNYGSSHEKD